MKDSLKNIIRLCHLWLGLASGVVLFIVCLTGSIYTFRTQIENALNSHLTYVEPQGNASVSLDTIVDELTTKGIKASQIIDYGKANRSIEILYSSSNSNGSGTYFINPYTAEIIGKRNTLLSPFFEVILSLHKSMLLSNAGKQIVGASVLIFVFMLLSGIILWIPAKLTQLATSLKIPWTKRKSTKLIDLHKIPGVYSLVGLLLIAIMGLYISYPWVKSTIIVSFGGNPVLSKASDEQKEKIHTELAGSFAASLQKIIANNRLTNSNQKINIQDIVDTANRILPYQGITTIVLPTNESSWVKIKKINRENALRALLPDELVFNKSGTLSQTKLFKDKSLDQKLITLSLPLHTGAILGWPSLIVYFLLSLIGASLPITGTLMWYRRKKAQFALRKGVKNTDPTLLHVTLDTKDWLIAYATKSGNSKLVALKLQEQFRKIGLKVRCQNASQLSPKMLAAVKYLFMVISTDGDGVPPPSAKKLFKRLSENTTHPLTNINFSICALGDSAYEAFCQAGKDMEQLLIKCNANQFMERVDCDSDFALSSTNWINNCFKNVLRENGIETSIDSNISQLDSSKNSSNKIRVSMVKRLTQSESHKPCYHLTLSSEKELNHIKPGDAIEINPKNPEWLVNQICTYLKVVKTKEITQKLIYEYELTSLGKSTVEKYQIFAKNERIQELLDTPSELRRYLAKANFYDLLLDFPLTLRPEDLNKILPKKKARLYSIASSTNLFPKEIHLTVKSVRYKFKSREHEGAGSIQLTDRIKINDIITYKHYPNLEFRLPEQKNIPIILIGVGTGIAPYRAFLQENQFANAKRETWLIWGDKERKKDYLYKDELCEFRSKGILNELNTTFSRDGEDKIYVQDLLKQNKRDLIDWINKDAHVYVCGSLKMAEDVKTVIENILTPHNNASLSFDDLIQQQRYHEDAY